MVLVPLNGSSTSLEYSEFEFLRLRPVAPACGVCGLSRVKGVTAAWEPLWRPGGDEGAWRPALSFLSLDPANSRNILLISCVMNRWYRWGRTCSSICIRKRSRLDESEDEDPTNVSGDMYEKINSPSHSRPPRQCQCQHWIQTWQRAYPCLWRQPATWGDSWPRSLSARQLLALLQGKHLRWPPVPSIYYQVSRQRIRLVVCWYMWDLDRRPYLPLMFWRNAPINQRKDLWVCHLGKTVRFEAL